jgi:putative transcriptional regulator
MTIRHHPDDATLMSFAAGSLPQAFAAVVAAHLSLCPRCRDEMATFELVGAALMDGLPPPPMRQATPAPQTWALPAVGGARRPGVRRNGQAVLPWPLPTLVGSGLDEVPWQPIARGLWQHHIPIPGRSVGRLRLLKAAPACSIPEHGHHGAEMTLVLQGAYSDETGEFRIGDMADLDEALEHTPVADQEVGCVCLLANEMPPRFKGFLLRLAQPFLKF